VTPRWSCKPSHRYNCLNGAGARRPR